MRLLPIAVLGAFVFFAFSGCVSYEKLVNFNEDSLNLDTVLIQNAPDIRIQADDVISIRVYGQDSKTTAPFNLTPIAASGNDFISFESIQLSGYLVDKKGAIDFPVLGIINLKGLTISETRDLLKEKLNVYLKDPVVNVRLLNFQVSVSGEVLNPGRFAVLNDRLTLPEAVAMAGDLTDYADRSDVMIVREEGGIRTFNHVNLLSSNLFQSEFFYLKQNDLVYVKPIRAKTGAVQDQSSKTLPAITAAATLIAVIFSILNTN